MTKSKENWLGPVVKKMEKGALRAIAKRHGALKNGIDPKWLEKASKGEGVSKTTQKRAVLAKTLKGFKKKK